MSAPSPAPYDLVKLREIIARSDYTDLRIFCADLREDYNTIVGEGATVRDAALSIVRYFENRGRIPELIARVRREFPSAEWAAVSNQLPPSPVISTGSGETRTHASQFGRAQVTPAPLTRATGPVRVFICHASPDKAKARELYAQLKAWGAESWLDEEDLIAGQDWRYEIRQAVQKSDVVLVCLSKASANHDGFIKDEIGYALNQADRQAEGAIFVVPLRLEACEVPERLARYHWVDWFEPSGPERLQRALRRRADEVSATLVAAGPAQPQPITPPTRDQIPQRDLIPDKRRISRRAVLAALGSAAGVGAAVWAVGRFSAPVIPAEPTPKSVAATATQPTQPTEAVLTAVPATLSPVAQSTSLPSTLSLTSPIKIDFVLVPAGSFLMGSDKAKDPNAFDDELPQHTVTLADFYIGKTEVTNAQFGAFVQATAHKTTAEQQGSDGTNWRHPRGPDSNIDLKAEHPVVQVSWHDAVAFCAWLSRESGRTVMLPSEAEWEKAARGVDGRIYPWGDDMPTAGRMNYNQNVGGTTPVGRYSPMGDSPYGCADMAGNVWEWTRSLWGKDATTPEFKYPYVANDGREDLAASDDVRCVLRGGSWFITDLHARAAYRIRFQPTLRFDLGGFRVVVGLPLGSSTFLVRRVTALSTEVPPREMWPKREKGIGVFFGGGAAPKAFLCCGSNPHPSTPRAGSCASSSQKPGALRSGCSCFG